MPSYNFKREAQVFIVTGGLRYRLDVQDISFSQTFSEESYPVRTLHAQNNVFEASNITKANAANFSFTVSAITEADFTVVRDRLLDYASFDLFIKTPVDTFKLETAVITNGSFGIEKSRPLSIQVQGEASKLTRGATLTGSLQNRSATMSYVIPKLGVTLNGSTLDGVVSVSIELQNEISWTPYTTVNNALTVTNAGNTMYPSTFTLSKRILAGSITQYLTDSSVANTQQWDTDASLTIQAGHGNFATSSFRGFKMGPATCSFTNRVGAGTVYTQNYDWRMTENVPNLATKLNYTTD